MSAAASQPGTRRALRVVAALFSGLLLVLCFPKPHLSFLSVVALIPLLLAVVSEARRRWFFFYGYLTGAVFLAGTMPWLYGVMKLQERIQEDHVLRRRAASMGSLAGASMAIEATK